MTWGSIIMWIFNKKKFIKTHIYPELLKFSKFVYTLWGFGNIFVKTNENNAKKYFIYRYTAPILHHDGYPIYKDDTVVIKSRFIKNENTGEIINQIWYNDVIMDSLMFFASTIISDPSDEKTPFKFQFGVDNIPSSSKLKHIYEVSKTKKLLNIVYRNCLMVYPPIKKYQ